jgi:hypothetical protein
LVLAEELFAVIARSGLCDEAIPNVAGDPFAPLAMTILKAPTPRRGTTRETRLHKSSRLDIKTQQEKALL